MRTVQLGELIHFRDGEAGNADLTAKFGHLDLADVLVLEAKDRITREHQTVVHRPEVRIEAENGTLPSTAAEGAYFFAADHLSAKSTGNILNVDAGNLAAFTR